MSSLDGRPHRPRWVIPLVLGGVIALALVSEFGIKAMRESNRQQGIALADQLRTAVITGDVAAATAALENGAPPQWTTASVDSNLRLAITSDNLAMVEVLLKHSHPLTATIGPHHLVSAIWQDIGLGDTPSVHGMPFTSALLASGVARTR